MRRAPAQHPASAFSLRDFQLSLHAERTEAALGDRSGLLPALQHTRAVFTTPDGLHAPRRLRAGGTRSTGPPRREARSPGGRAGAGGVVRGARARQPGRGDGRRPGVAARSRRRPSAPPRLRTPDSGRRSPVGKQSRHGHRHPPPRTAPRKMHFFL